MPSLNDLLYDLRRIEAHREKLTEKQIEQIYESLVKKLNHFLADEFYRYSNEQGALSYDTLQQKIREAKFLEEIIENVDSISPEIRAEILSLAEETYSACYIGMNEAVKELSIPELSATMSKTIVKLEILKQTFNNGITKLTLLPLLERHRQDIVYTIKQELTIGLINGDRQDVMIRKIAEKLELSERKASQIVKNHWDTLLKFNGSGSRRGCRCAFHNGLPYESRAPL